MLPRRPLRLDDIRPDLPDQLLNVPKGPRRPDLSQEIDAQPLPVEVPLKPDEMRLQLVSLLAEGGIGPDVDGRRPGGALMVRDAGIDAIARDQRRYLMQVGRREADG